MNKQRAVQKTIRFVREKLKRDRTGHDWPHLLRVRRIALFLAKKEGADRFIVEIAALLHDIADWKFNHGDEYIGVEVAKEWLSSIGIDKNSISAICKIIGAISFKGAGVNSAMRSMEGMVVQDADRLDALGAIGIARAFAYGGYAQRELHNPESAPKCHTSFASYKGSKGTTVNHFYEKLLLLKDRMNTKTAKKIAKKRHLFMKKFLEHFFEEWERKDIK